jgi:hypothetical protein
MRAPITPLTRLATTLLLGVISLTGQAAALNADVIYQNGQIYTVDAKDSLQQALAIKDGRLLYVGSNAGAAHLATDRTKVIDLHGRLVMPGLIDGHMHPLEAGSKLLKCSLNYEPLSTIEFQQRIQACLDASQMDEPSGWLEVVAWFQQSMPKASREVLDTLNTRRPILVRDSFGHTVLANSNALVLANITRVSKDPIGGLIERDSHGEPTGLLQDAAFECFDALLPKMTPQQAEQAARAALTAMAQQGVTSFLDAMSTPESLTAFTTVAQAGSLTARAHFAPVIDPADTAPASAVVAKVMSLRQRFDQGSLKATPSITVRNAKIFMDGVIAGPAFTGAMLEPYFTNIGTEQTPEWQPSTQRGPDVYFPAPRLKAIILALAKAGIDPHLHVDGDRAVREALNAIESLRITYPHSDIRPALAHCEIIDPADFARFHQLNVFPVLSMQWEKRAPDTVDQLRDYLGPVRAALLEPAGVLAAAGAPIAFGSDWPVDALDEWFAFKVGVTRENSVSAGPRYAGRLGTDPGLTVKQVLRAATIHAAQELHQDQVTGSLEIGKFADLIILDRSPLDIAPSEIATVRVVQTVVGGRVVYTDGTL